MTEEQTQNFEFQLERFDNAICELKDSNKYAKLYAELDDIYNCLYMLFEIVSINNDLEQKNIQLEQLLWKYTTPEIRKDIGLRYGIEIKAPDLSKSWKSVSTEYKK